MDETEREVWETVEALNACWTAGDPADLAGFFHESMIAVTPGDQEPLIGGKECVAAWTAYAKGTKILSWETRDRAVRVYDRTAVVAYRYSLAGEREGERVNPRGRDLMVLIRRSGRWWLVADSFTPDPSARDL
ncbi:MAG: nuclear transport factor 2 family protein [Candidatus Eisenbacteria bacterium]